MEKLVLWWQEWSRWEREPPSKLRERRRTPECPDCTLPELHPWGKLCVPRR